MKVTNLLFIIFGGGVNSMEFYCFERFGNRYIADFSGESTTRNVNFVVREWSNMIVRK